MSLGECFAESADLCVRKKPVLNGLIRAMHFVLFCIRCRIEYGSGLGRFPWVLPVGQLEFKVSIKLLREPEREDEAREGTV